jgi:TolA-binding protein
MSQGCRNDLVLRERRSPLSSSEELALRAHLDVCESCRLTREIGAAFDEQGELELDDGARVARLAAGARTPRRAFSRRTPRVIVLAACISLLAGAAAAAIGWVQRPAKVVNAPPTGSNAAQATARTAQTSWPAAATLLPERAASEPPEAAATMAPPKAAAAVSPPSAAQLFRKANEARRAGQAQQAIQLYRSLQRDFPGSAEAALSPVSLGSLLLNRASAGAALAQFDHYLAASPSAPLAAEALYGRARALSALGRHSEEKQTWQQLLARFPGCPYRESARRRLGELR